MNLFEHLLSEIETLKSSLEKKLLESIINDNNDLSGLLSYVVANELKNDEFIKEELKFVLLDAIKAYDYLLEIIIEDIQRYLDFDFSANHLYEIIFFRKGFHALLAYRISHHYEQKGLHIIAEWIRHRSSIVFQVDISPKAKLGRGIVLDHATGIVIGETAEVGNNCSVFHNVTLGSTAKKYGIRHPKIGNNTLIGCGASLLGVVTINDDSVIKASTVIVDV